jgi:CheY-like chemotaxis protein
MAQQERGILVVDDDKAAAQMLQLRLARAGYNTHVAYDGREAIRLFDAVQPRWVFLDASMPDVSGLEVCQHIRQYDADHTVRVIFLSGAEMPSQDFIRNCASWSGADQFISKPYQASQIIDLIERSECGESKHEEGEVVDCR